MALTHVYISVFGTTTFIAVLYGAKHGNVRVLRWKMAKWTALVQCCIALV